MLRIITRVGCGALAALLAAGTNAQPLPWTGAPAPRVISKVIRRSPYELSIHLTVNGHPLTLDRSGVCSLVVTRYHDWPVPARSSWQWSDDIPHAAAVILPDQEGFVIQLPELCFWPRPGETGREQRAKPPLISQGTLDRFIPTVVWTRNARHIDSFEMYTAITGGALPSRHVRVNSIGVRAPGSQSHPIPATAAETALAERFNSAYLNGAGATYVAHAAYVRPVSGWEKDLQARTYFARHGGLLFIPAPGSPLAEPPDVANVYRALSKHLNIVDWGPAGAASYEVPMVLKGNDWVLDPSQRGVRIYYRYSEVQRVPGQRYYRIVIKRPGWGPEAPLLYKGFRLYPPMNGRQRTRYLQAHQDVRQVTDGRLFDPEASVLIGVGVFEMSR